MTSKRILAGVFGLLVVQVVAQGYDVAPVVDCVAYFLLCYAICHFLYRRQVFIRI